jgi:hypothetical protein
MFGVGEEQAVHGDGGSRGPLRGRGRGDRHVLPGQPLESEGQDRLVVLDREQVLGAALVHQVGGVGALNRESATSALPNSGAAGTR